MNRTDFTVARTPGAILETNKVLKNTYMLLSMTLLFSAVMAVASIFLAVPSGISFASLIVGILMGIFVLPRTANSSTGIWVVFGITGLLGFSLGPMLSTYLSLPKGPEIVGTALGGTGIIFLGLSGYVLTTRKDFSFMGGFLMVGLMVAALAMLANLFLEIPALSLAISGAIILVMSGLILFETSRIIHGGETNYIMATYGLYLSIFQIFIHLLAILGIMGDD